MDRMRLIDENLPVVIIATRDRESPGSVLRYEKSLGNITGFKKQSSRVIALASEGDKEVSKLADHTIFIPTAPELLSPILEIVPLAAVRLLHGGEARVWTWIARAIW